MNSRDIDISILDGDYNSFLDLVRPIAVPRVSGTPEIIDVQNFIVKKMSKAGWKTELDTFEDQTPFGVKRFSNIISTYEIGKNFAYSQSEEQRHRTSVLNKRVIMACHYDSKYFSQFKFDGAIDSAVPCAMLLDLADFLSKHFTPDDFSNIQRHLQFIFFDGEEAFKDWTSTDSTYGSRHYSEKLWNIYKQNSFDSIDLFILLDLLGGDVSDFPNYFPEATSNIYKKLSFMESNLRKKGLLSKKTQYYFKDTNGMGRFHKVDDDHRPFMERNVPILHLIPNPFPSVWHNQRDTVANLNQDHIQDLRIILKYLLLDILNNPNIKNSNSSNPDNKDEF